MDTREITAQGLVGETNFPATRRQRLHIAGGVATHALEHVNQIGVRINPVQATGDKQALNNPHMLGTDFRPIE